MNLDVRGKVTLHLRRDSYHSKSRVMGSDKASKAPHTSSSLRLTPRKFSSSKPQLVSMSISQESGDLGFVVTKVLLDNQVASPCMQGPSRSPPMGKRPKKTTTKKEIEITTLFCLLYLLTSKAPYRGFDSTLICIYLSVMQCSCCDNSPFKITMNSTCTHGAFGTHKRRVLPSL